MHSACSLLRRCNKKAGIFAFCFSRQSFAKTMDISVTSLVWSGAKKCGVLQGGGAPGQGLHPGAGVAHTVPSLHPLPAPQAQAGQKFEFWRISSLSRIADFQLIFRVWFIGPFPKICLRWSTFGTVKVCSLRVPVYNIVHLDHMKTKLFLFEQLFW